MTSLQTQHAFPVPITFPPQLLSVTQAPSNIPFYAFFAFYMCGDSPSQQIIFPVKQAYLSIPTANPENSLLFCAL